LPFAIKRIYDSPSPSDGLRILVDRLWPRGVSKEKAELSEWCRDLAPSKELREQFHGAGDWDRFCEAYATDLDKIPGEVERLHALARTQTVTLLYALKDEERNNAVALKQYLEQG
jgi:uncharacterized protein YeaO (DUF488 family)